MMIDYASTGFATIKPPILEKVQDGATVTTER